jgi:hypothetical protein
VQGKQDLLLIVLALGPPSRAPRGLHGGQQHGDQDSNNGDNHQQFNQSESRETSFLHENSPSPGFHRTSRSFGKVVPAKLSWTESEMLQFSDEGSVRRRKSPNDYLAMQWLVHGELSF